MRISVPRVPLAVVALVIAGVAVTGCQRGPSPPDIASLGTLDPAVSALLTEQVSAVRESPGGASEWGGLAMAFEANGFTAQARDAYTTAAASETSHGRWWYHLARLRSREGDIEGALAAFDKAIAISPAYVPARWRRGQLLLDRGDLAGAEAAFRVAVNLESNDLAAATGVARVQLAKGQHADAAAGLEALVARAPNERYVYQLLSAAYRALGRERDAAEASAAGASGEPAWNDPWADEVGQYRRGFASALKEATALALAGRYPEAVGVLEQLHAERPDDRELRTYLGGVYATAGRIADARTMLAGVLKQFPDDFDATINMATTHMFAGTFGEAERFVVRALDLRNGNADAVRLRGVIAWRSGRLDDAERWLAAAAAANPQDAKALGWIGTIRLERNRAPAALEAFRQALARDPLLGDALVDGAAAAVASGALEDASRWIARARRVAPSHPRLAEVERRVNARGRS